ncbi:hypothetical protein [Teredinibacter sp. KSP-S5-2]|uniref:hypothetical protein n=1 Tax=Teredinibacter sp. KSP-S5-2 TaxID=3034506 RepID=UPI0029352B88|nr:hypothetical protein [Teredinibacter sp. KSP-S5-2]WNO10073.1 hypothetical protein P5V12_02695 [Teredinibacter sp. KSP-S5-2]
MEEELLDLQRRLNSAEYVAEEIYRRNEINYPLVCYINNITGCYISGNYEVIVLFIGRARKHMKESREKLRESGYYSLVEEYLSIMERYLKSKGIEPEYSF